MMKSKRKFPGFVSLGLMLLFFYGPIIVLMVYSFNGTKSLTTWTGFSFQWYEKLFKSREALSSMRTSVVVATIATFVSTIVGTITAIGLSKHKPIVRKAVLNVNNFPVLNPEIVTAISFMLLFIAFRIQKGFMTMLIAHITFCTPYVILTVLPKLRRLDPSLADAAMDLGARPIQALTKVILPQIMPAIISGALIAFTMSFDDFVISYFATGNGVSNISILVYNMAQRIDPSINALSTIVVVIITLALLVINVIPLLNKNKKGLNL